MTTTEPTTLSVFVAGIPRPQGSKRPLRNKHTGKIHMIEQSKDVGTWREDIRQAVLNADRPAEPLDGPLHATLVFVLARPKGHYRTGRNADVLRDTAPPLPIGKPDIDKLARAVLDAVGSAGLWGDDAQVAELSAIKRYALSGGKTGVYINIGRFA